MPAGGKKERHSTTTVTPKRAKPWPRFSGGKFAQPAEVVPAKAGIYLSAHHGSLTGRPPREVAGEVEERILDAASAAQS